MGSWCGKVATDGFEDLLVDGGVSMHRRMA